MKIRLLHNIILQLLFVIFSALFGNIAIAESSVRSIDFNNFTYNLKPGGIGPSGKIKLLNGHYREKFGYVHLEEIYYQDLNGDGQEDAIVVLMASGGGSGDTHHAIGITFTNGIRELFSFINFLDFKPRYLGFDITYASPSSTGGRYANVFEIKTYNWDKSKFTLKNTEIINSLEFGTAISMNSLVLLDGAYSDGFEDGVDIRNGKILHFTLCSPPGLLNCPEELKFIQINENVVLAEFRPITRSKKKLENDLHTMLFCKGTFPSAWGNPFFGDGGMCAVSGWKRR
jgi:hypothetical protein